MLSWYNRVELRLQNRIQVAMAVVREKSEEKT